MDHLGSRPLAEPQRALSLLSVDNMVRPGRRPSLKRRATGNTTITNDVAQVNAALQPFLEHRRSQWTQESGMRDSSSSERPLNREERTSNTSSTPPNHFLPATNIALEAGSPSGNDTRDSLGELSPQVMQSLRNAALSQPYTSAGDPGPAEKLQLESDQRTILPSPPPSVGYTDPPMPQPYNAFQPPNTQSAPILLVGPPVGAGSANHAPTAQGQTTGYFGHCNVQEMPTAIIIPLAAPSAPPHPQSIRQTPLSSSSSPQQRHNEHTPLQYAQDVLSRDGMLPLLNRFWHNFSRSRPTPDVDGRRVSVLRCAVENNDLFFVILHQLYSLKSCEAGSLPLPIASMPDSHMGAVSSLLCSNADISPDLCRWFADFPAPIASIYHSTARNTYARMVNQVTGFLLRMPTHLKMLTDQCIARSAPPLCQEMITQLHLHSPVLQAITFRAIVRYLVGAGNRCESLLDGLHRFEQQVYLQRRQQNYRGEQNQQNWHAYSDIVTFWRRHNQSRRDPNTFSVPLVTINHIKNILSSGSAAPQGSVTISETNNSSKVGSAPPSIAPAQTEPHLPQQSQSQLMAIISAQQAPINQDRQPIINAQQMPMMPTHQRPPSRSWTGQQPSAVAQYISTMQMHQGRPPLGTYRSSQSSPSRFMPPEGAPPAPQPTVPDTTRTALHQAHLRSPILAYATGATGDNSSRLFRYVKGFALHPTPLKDLPIQEVSFDVSQEDFARLLVAEPQTTSPGARPIATFNDTSIAYRLRGSYNPAAGFPTEYDWMVMETSWPSDLYVSLNGLYLEERRKLHHGRCLPIDLTRFLVPGQNKITVCVEYRYEETKAIDYVLAVEIIGFATHCSIVDGIRHLSAEESVAAIKAKLTLAGRADNGKHGDSDDDDNDDDVSVTSSNLTIKLLDPFSGAKIFTTPVRGLACTHQECFDLDTFLEHCKREEADGPTVVDCWRCPWCRADVRPQTLLIDDFPVQVRRDLERSSMLHADAIVVEADGTWKPKVKEQKTMSNANIEQAGLSSKCAKVVEVIEID